MTFIYCLAEPHSGVIRYVGKANNPAERLRHHLKDRMACHRTDWLAKLKHDGLHPVVVPLEECSEKVWQERERHWIAFLREQGADLVNDTDGGEGGAMGPEARAKTAQANKGNIYSLGRKHSPETIEKLRESHKGKSMLPQTRAAIAKANIGSKRSPEARARMRAAKYGMTVTLETRQKIRNTLKDKPWSEARREAQKRKAG